MSGPDFSSIPLPTESDSIVMAKKSAKEMLQKALMDHKLSHSNNPSTPVSNTSFEGVAENNPSTSATKNSQASSKSIVDELFKDFISQKLKSSKRPGYKIEKARNSKTRSSADEISKLLDLEIQSIQSSTENKAGAQHNDNLNENLVINKEKQCSVNSNMLPQKEKRGKSDNGISSSPSDTKKNVDLPSSSISSDLHVPILNHPIMPVDHSDKDAVDNQVTATASQTVDSERTTESLTIQDKLATKTTDAGAINTQTTTTHAPAVASTQQLDIPPPPNPPESSQASQNAPPTRAKPVSSEDVPLKKNLMLPLSLARRMGAPKILGVKLSSQSLSLITSKDRIDIKGRLWEEGEIQSSHSEDSDDDLQSDGFPSESGSVISSADDKKVRASKHKKKHKHKHKKKRKKSGKDEDVNRKEGGGKHEHHGTRHENTNSNGNDKEEGSSQNNKSMNVTEHENNMSDLTEDPNDISSKNRVKHSMDTSDTKQEEPKKKQKGKSKKRRKQSHSSSRSRSRSPKKHKKSRSRSRSTSSSPIRRKRKSSTESTQFSEWDARHYSSDPSKFEMRDRSRSRSRSKGRSSHKHKKSKDMERSRSTERDKCREEGDKDLRVRIDKAKLRKIAIANALQNMKAGQGPQVDITAVKCGGKSVEELTEFCKKISEKNKSAGSDEVSSSDEEAVNKSEEEDVLIHHPFKLKEPNSSNIVMNIRNAKQLPVLTPSEKQAQQASLRLTFPVSSGSHHRASESEWVPVVRTTVQAVTTPTVSVSQSVAPVMPPVETKPVDSIFPDPVETSKIDIGVIISERLQAVRKLQENPYDMQALTKMHKAQEQANRWATSQHLPGQFTGSTGAHVLSQEQLIGNKRQQAWVKKSQLVTAAPLAGGIGMFLLQKMGWKQGEGLGKNNEGSKEPLLLDIKNDRRGLTTPAENPRSKMRGGPGAAARGGHGAAARGGPAAAAAVTRAKDLSNKHPVSALMELCNRRKWEPPSFTIVSEDGPDHKKNFLFKVRVNNVEYQPAGPSTNKKTAKAMCAAVCLQEMGLLPRDAPLNI